MKDRLAYAGAVVMCLALLAAVLRLWQADLAVPFRYADDALCTQAWAQGLAENGWFLSNPRLGAPFGQDLRDFPLLDSLHFLLLRLLAAIGGPVLAVNLYFLLTFPLTTLSALWALRRLGVPHLWAALAALLFTFLPYHFLRGESHLFLSAYYLVPPLALVALRLHNGPLRGRRLLGAALVCLLVSCAGVYYAFFGCYFLLVAGAAASLRRRRAAPLATAAALAGLVALGVAANLAPTIAHQLRHGPNPEAVQRCALQAEVYGLRLGQLLLPVRDHRLAPLARCKARFDQATGAAGNESSTACLGLVGSVGFLYLLGRILARRATGPPRPECDLLDGLALLNLAGVLLATAGGLGTVFSFAVHPAIRCYNRICVYLAFFALSAVALLLARARSRLLAGGLSAALLLGGVLDQTTDRMVPDYEGLRRQYHHDRDFFARVEAALPPEAMIFQLPCLAFPEGQPVGQLTSSYDLLRGYLHSRTLRWNFGAVRGRYAAAWQQCLADRPLPERVDALACAGFGGIVLDRFGLSEAGAEEAGLACLLGAEPIISGDGRLAFFDLAGHAARLRQRCGGAAWERRQRALLAPVVARWHNGFSRGERWHWARRRGDLLLHNPSDRPRTVTLSFRVEAVSPAPARLRLRGARMGRRKRLQTPAATWTVGREGRDVARTLEVPPGAHALHLESADLGTQVFRVGDLRVGERP
jgi:phosphoglycerol transferase